MANTEEIKQDLLARLADPSLTADEIEKIEKKLSLLKEHS